MKYHRRRISQGKRDAIMAKTGGACYYCGYAATDIDHIAPHSYVANDTEQNLIPACSICNGIAGNKHFKSLSAKKKYIKQVRKSERWRRKLARMVVTLIGDGFYQKPMKPKRVKSEPVKSFDIMDIGPTKNPFRTQTIPSKPRKKPQPRPQEALQPTLRVRKGKDAPERRPAIPRPNRPRVWGRSGKRVNVWD